MRQQSDLRKQIGRLLHALGNSMDVPLIVRRSSWPCAWLLGESIRLRARAIPPPLESLILTHILQIDFVKGLGKLTCMGEIERISAL
jgi:hypothetical protein